MDEVSAKPLEAGGKVVTVSGHDMLLSLGLYIDALNFCFGVIWSGCIWWSLLGWVSAFVLGLVAASAVELVAACAVAWTATSAVAWAEMSAVVEPAAGLKLAAVKLKVL